MFEQKCDLWPHGRNKRNKKMKKKILSVIIVTVHTDVRRLDYNGNAVVATAGVGGTLTKTHLDNRDQERLQILKLMFLYRNGGHGLLPKIVFY